MLTNLKYMYMFHCNHSYYCAFQKHEKTLKFKSQLMFAFYSAFNHLGGLLRKQNFPVFVKSTVKWNGDEACYTSLLHVFVSFLDMTLHNIYM